MSAIHTMATESDEVSTVPMAKAWMPYAMTTESFEASTAADAVMGLPAEFHVVKTLYLVSMPCLMLLGAIGNILSFALMWRRNIRKLSMSTYLSVLAITDTWYLWHGGLWYFIRYASNLLLDFSTLMKCMDYSVYWTSSNIASWILVALAVERFIALYYPHKAARWCTVHKARLVCSVIITVQAALHFRKWFTWRPVAVAAGVEVCFALPILAVQISEYSIWPWIDNLSYIWLPASIMIFVDVLIVIKLYKLRHSNTQNTESSVTRSSKKMAVTLLSVTVAFIILTLPIGCFWIYNNVNHMPSLYDSLPVALVTILMQTNHSINFLLYCCFSSKFRRELRAMFCMSNAISPHIRSVQPNVQPNT